MAAIPTFNNIKELKNYLIKQERKKIKYTKKEILDAKKKLKVK